MNTVSRMMKKLAQLGLLLVMGVSMNADAGLFGFGGTSWKEEALLHDGSRIIVERSVKRGGRHEIGQQPAYEEQSLSFTMPGTKQEVVWEDKSSEDLGSASFLPMLLDIYDETAYLIASPMGCLSYNKWGRPNPPYVVFRYQDKEWQRITLQELPVEIKTPNLIFSDPDNVVKKIGKSLIPADTIQQIISRYRQPEFKTILREPVNGGKGITTCEEMIHYKCGWISPHGTFGRELMDRTCKDK